LSERSSADVRARFGQGRTESKRLHRRVSLSTSKRCSPREVAAELARLGYVSAGKPFAVNQVVRLLAS